MACFHKCISLQLVDSCDHLLISSIARSCWCKVSDDTTHWCHQTLSVILAIGTSWPITPEVGHTCSSLHEGVNQGVFSFNGATWAAAYGTVFCAFTILCTQIIPSLPSACNAGIVTIHMFILALPPDVSFWWSECNSRERDCCTLLLCPYCNMCNVEARCDQNAADCNQSVRSVPQQWTAEADQQSCATLFFIAIASLGPFIC